MKIKNKECMIARIVIIILGFFLALSSSVQAQESDRRLHRDSRQDRAHRMHDKLDLSEEQRKSLKRHKQKHRHKMKALKEKMRAKRQALREEMQKSDFDAAKVRALNKEIKILHNESSYSRLEGVLGVRDILTPEQFSKFKQYKENRRDKIKERRSESRERFKSHRDN